MTFENKSRRNSGNKGNNNGLGNFRPAKIPQVYAYNGESEMIFEIPYWRRTAQRETNIPDIDKRIIDMVNSYQAPVTNNAQPAGGETVNSADLTRDLRVVFNGQKQEWNRVLEDARSGNGKLNSAAKEAWDLYIDKNQSSESGRKNGHRSVNFFFDYLGISAIDEPTVNDVLDCLRYKLRMRTPYITSGCLEAFLNAIRNFFKFTADNDIYPDITKNLSVRDSLRVYREVTGLDW